MAALAVPLAATAAWGVDGTWAPSRASQRHVANDMAVSASTADAAPTNAGTATSTQLKWRAVRETGSSAAGNSAAKTSAAPTTNRVTKPIFAKPASTITLTAAQNDEEDDLFKAPSPTKPKAPPATKPNDPFEDGEDLSPKPTDPTEDAPELMDEPEPTPKAEPLPEPDEQPEPPRIKNPMQPTPSKQPRTPTPRTQPRRSPSADGYAPPRASATLDDLEDCDTAKKKMLANRLANIGLDIRVSGQQGTDVPPECDLDNGQFAARSWCETTVLWKASALCHKPLYFEDVQLERYGHEWGPVLQPVVSGVHFFGTLPILPYKMGLQTPNECVYALGYYRPGSCAPYMIDPIPFTWRAALFEAGAWVGGAAAIP